MADLELEELLIQASKEGSAELRRRFSGPRAVEKKGAIDIVTDADRAAEEIVLGRLSRDLPNAVIIAEESGKSGGQGALSLYVDPLDGTTNYAGGIPHFAVSIAAVDAQGPKAGVVADVMRDEIFSATRGTGARLCVAGGKPESLRVSEVPELEDATLVTGFPYDLRQRPDELLDMFRAFLLTARGVRRYGSAALDLAWVASGRFSGFWESGLKSWDVAAGFVIATEAGAELFDYSGGPAQIDGKEIVAANPALARQMLAVLAGLKG